MFARTPAPANRGRRVPEGGPVRLDKRQIDGLTCPPGRRDLLVFDEELHGFGIRVTAAGAKTFLLQYQLGGRGGRRVRMML